MTGSSTPNIDAKQPEQCHISHTVYEPNFFTPLVRLSTTAQGPQAKPHVLELAMHEGDEEELHQLQNMPEGMQQMMDKSLRQAMREGLLLSMQAMFSTDTCGAQTC